MTEQPKHKAGCNYLDADPCSCGTILNKPEHPNTNAMIFEQIEGCSRMIEILLSQLIPKTTHVEGCIVTHKSWQDNNLKHLQKAFE